MLLHPSSLPSGKLDHDAIRWLDWMAESGLSVWQMLPLSIPDHTGSPYQSLSAFAVHPGFIGENLNHAAHISLDEYREQQNWWVEDYAMFRVFKDIFDNQPWWEWPEDCRTRSPERLAQLQHSHKAELESYIEEQYRLDLNWDVIHRHAKSKGIQLFGDMPIFIAQDSADVWANPQEFLLGDDYQPTYVAGVPPDYFSEFGQRWGNPHYNWECMQEENFSWWKRRLQRQFDWFDIVRIDHFRGLEAAWMIEAECETAVEGFWQKAPGDALLEELKKHYPDLPIVAEDLGIITDEVRELAKKYELPGMSVLQFAFDYFDDNPHKPKNLHPERVVYTGTHDNNTTIGWFDTLNDEEKAFVFTTLDVEPTEDIVELMTTVALESEANLAIMPMQDLLKLGEEARMNVPGMIENNWHWQFQWTDIPSGLASSLDKQIEHSDRSHAV